MHATTTASLLDVQMTNHKRIKGGHFSHEGDQIFL